MPLPIAHSLFAASIVAATHNEPTKRLAMPLCVGAFLANSPDFDFALVFLLGSKDWHRGFSHSILFAAIVLVVIALSRGRSKLRESIAFGLAYASHFVLDFSTTKYGDGLQLFWFFDPERFGLRWFGLSEMPSNLSVLEVSTTLFIEFSVFAPILGFIIYLRSLKFQEI
jgi:inner membrane protein